MKINIVTLGEMHLGATYDITFLSGGSAERVIFTGLKYHPKTRTFSLYFYHPVAGEIGYGISAVVIADLVEPVSV